MKAGDEVEIAVFADEKAQAPTLHRGQVTATYDYLGVRRCDVLLPDGRIYRGLGPDAVQRVDSDEHATGEQA